VSKIVVYGQALFRGFPFKAFTRDIWLICLSNIIGAFGEGLYFYVFPLYIKTLQADYVQIGLVFSALYGASALTLLLGGVLADRFDRKKILIMAWAPWACAPLIYSFASNWQQLIPGAVCWGVSMMGVPAFNAYIITSTRDKTKIASVLSFVWASYSFSYIFAPTVGGYLATAIGMRLVLLLSALLGAMATGVFFFLRSQRPLVASHKTQRQSAPSDRSRMPWRKMLLWSICFALITFFMTVGRTFVPTFLSEQVGFSEFYVALFGSVGFAGMTVLGVTMGHLGDRWRKPRAIGLCLFVFLASTVSLFLVREIAVLMLVAFFFGGSGVTGSLVSSFIGSIAPENRRGLWLSVPQTLSLVAAFAAPYLAGFLYTLDPNNTLMFSIVATPFLILFALVGLKE